MGTVAEQTLPPYGIHFAALGVAQRFVAVLLMRLEVPTFTISIGTFIRRIHHRRLNSWNAYSQAHLSPPYPRCAYPTTNFPILETVTYQGDCSDFGEGRRETDFSLER